ncbi:MAG: hypothetical protein CME06_12280 [Gemmatimonadetes bacterium]|nr:hypothetical protein [Gemmatimonadota bacterium]
MDRVGLEWKGIGLKYLWDNIYTYYRVEDTTIWNGFQTYICDSSWIDYSNVASGELLTPGERNRIRFSATNESDWSEHVVDTMRWSFHGWHPGESAGVSSATLRRRDME